MATFRIIISLLISFTFINNALAQFVLKSDKDLIWYRDTPKESIAFTTNSNTLVSGETLYYKVLCKNDESNEISTLSNIAYVELQNENGLVFLHKLVLKNGVGEGLFTFTEEYPTGHYKLLGYTNWMKNYGNSFHTEANLIVINPADGIQFRDGQTDFVNNEPTTNDNSISIKTDASTYQKRSKASLKINSDDLNIKLGNYAISVSKINHLDTLFTTNSIPLKSNTLLLKADPKNIGDTIFLPETSGEIISGRVLDKASKKPIALTRVMLSILDDSAFQDFAITNADGLFTFTLKKHFKSDKALIQTIEGAAKNAIINFDIKTSIDNNKLKFKSVTITKNLKELIRKRSVASQIETAYSEIKQNTPVAVDYAPPFYGNHEYEFLLDDYKRFPTLAETLIEVVEHAWHERYKGKERAVNIRERENSPYYDENILPIVVYDGAYIKTHNDVLFENANNIESVSVFRDEYYYGNKVYQGALMIKSKDRKYYETLVSDNAILVDLIKAQNDFVYFKEDYSRDKSERIPDLRKDLLWLPNYVFSSANSELFFYTSDLEDNYRIILEGTAKNGDAIYLEKDFKVQN